jgi:hypothetical protein
VGWARVLSIGCAIDCVTGASELAIRLILAASIGGIVLMAWGVFHWFVLPVEQVVSHVPEEAELLSALRRPPSAGVYVLPYPLDPATEAGFETDFLSAPRWTIFYGPGGDDPFGVPVFAIGLLHAIAAAAVISVLVLLGGVEQLGRGRRYVFILLAGASGSYIGDAVRHLVSSSGLFSCTDGAVPGRRLGLRRAAHGRHPQGGSLIHGAGHCPLGQVSDRVMRLI